MNQRSDRPSIGQIRKASGSHSALRPSPSARLTRLEEWMPTAARIILGLVFVWFGANELVEPRLWTGYVPFLAAQSTAAMLLVLLHGGLLWLLATALILGIAPRTAALISLLVMLEVILPLIIAHGLSDLVARDFGVLGLALAVIGSGRQRLLLSP